MIQWQRMAALRNARPWMTNTALCLAGLGLLMLTRQFVRENDHYGIGFSGCSGWSVWLYVAAIIIVMTQPFNRATFGIIIGFAVALQMATLFADPFMSTDIYRYVWDGVVQHAGINPYRYVPGDKALTFLRAPNQDIFDNINRRDYAHTIYPPAAQMFNWLVTWFSPTVTAMKAGMFCFECVTAAALIALLRRMQRPPEQVLLFAWCPLLAWEIGGSGHVDAVVMGFVVLAMLFRHREQPVLTGLFLGLAVITKFYPLVLLPALWTRRGWRVDWKLPATMAAVVAVGYACYASVGMKVFGFLGGYAKEEGIDSGARFFLLDLTQSVHGLAWVSKTCFMVFCVLVMGAISLWAWQYAMPEVCSRGTKEPHFLRAAMLLGLAMMLLFSPHYAWYVVWLIPFMALDPWLPLLVYLMSFFYLFTTGLADPGPKMFLLNEILYGIVAFMIFLQVTVLRRWSLRSIFRVDAPPENTVRSFQPQEVEAN